METVIELWFVIVGVFLVEDFAIELAFSIVEWFAEAAA